MSTFPRFINVVPNHRTRAVATRMVRLAEERNGADAVLECIADVDPQQIPALIAVLLTSTKVHKKTGRPPMPIQFDHADRLRGYRQYRQGSRTEFAVAAYREYQRINRRKQRQRDGTRAPKSVAGSRDTALTSNPTGAST
ncbi:hypothetical protein K8Z61_18415 [Nocardioides sp. TRM66260-LWL]|uniref:hypothetical protein n=1 Tax=Nocardioides sp. TRM66260-LWL TaxID=2874478 RepID=UPI001CC3D87C|nr:hypothetical protein [Nocardioides sp. TRM66260-LWL]MBZ5736469.1 hypothetical protein [Nocardioides sp. TRM66260-LWL]